VVTSIHTESHVFVFIYVYRYTELHVLCIFAYMCTELTWMCVHGMIVSACTHVRGTGLHLFFKIGYSKSGTSNDGCLMQSLGRDLIYYKVGPAHKHLSLEMLQRTACIYFVKA